MTQDVLCCSQFQGSNLIACSCKLYCDMVTISMVTKQPSTLSHKEQKPTLETNTVKDTVLKLIFSTFHLEGMNSCFR